MSHDRDMRWAEEIRSGSTTSFKALFEEYYSTLCDYGVRLTRDLEVTEDLVQDVFVWVWQEREHWRPETSVRRYLLQAVHNRVITKVRRKRKELGLDKLPSAYQKASQISQSEELQNGELRKAILTGIAQLPLRRRHILVLHLLHDMRYGEIAMILGISVNTVDTQIRRARKLLRHRLRVYS